MPWFPWSKTRTPLADLLQERDDLIQARDDAERMVAKFRRIAYIRRVTTQHWHSAGPAIPALVWRGWFWRTELGCHYWHGADRCPIRR